MTLSRQMTTDEEPATLFSRKVAFLANSRNWPESPPSVEIKTTHMSVLFLFPNWVYKMKRPIQFESLDYRSIPARKKATFAEFKLNQDLAPTIYHKPTPLYQDPASEFSFKYGRVVAEWLLKMRRLDSRRLLSSQITDHSWNANDLIKAAKHLALFYQQQKPAPIDLQQYLNRIKSALKTNHDRLISISNLDQSKIKDVCNSLNTYLHKSRKDIQYRFNQGKIIEGHGDLKAEHIHLSDTPVIIDRLEFDKLFRYVDPLEDLALLTIDCELLGDRKPAQFFLESYKEMCHDSFPNHIWNFFKSNQALIRCRLAAWHINDAQNDQKKQWRSKSLRLLDMALRESQSLNRLCNQSR